MPALLELTISKEVTELFDFVQVAEAGLGAALAGPDLLDAMSVARKSLKWPGSAESDREAMVKAQRLEQVAQRQASTGFDYLFGLASVKLWSILEATVDDIALECLKVPADCKDAALLNGLRGPLIEYAAASQLEQAEFLLAELRRAVKAPFKLVVGAFEAVLEPVGMSGSIREDIRKHLLELQQVRHVLVHRRGIVDKRFLAACPWTSLPVGAQLQLRRTHFGRYVAATYLYGIELNRRNCVRAGANLPPTLEADVRRLTETLEKLSAD